MKIFTRSLTLLALLGLALSVQAQTRYVEGTHYDELSSPVRTSNPNKIEVTEVFWYGCGHCYSFEPLLESWTEDLASDVEFVRSPGMWNQMMETHARIYYTAQSLDVVEEVHPLAFNAIHQRGNYLDTEEAVAELFAEVGVSQEAFDNAWNSFSVTSSVNRAGTRMRDYGVRGVPSLIVNGKYRISAGGAVPTQSDMLKVADFLIEQERDS